MKCSVNKERSRIETQDGTSYKLVSHRSPISFKSSNGVSYSVGGGTHYTVHDQNNEIGKITSLKRNKATFVLYESHIKTKRMTLDFNEIIELLIVAQVDLSSKVGSKLVYYFTKHLEKETEFTIYSVKGTKFIGKILVTEENDYVEVFNEVKQSWNIKITIKEFINMLRV